MKRFGFIFDMDGLLIDSEPFWKKVEKSVFKNLGIYLTDDMCNETVGLRLEDIIMHWYKKLPWKNYNLSETKKAIITGMANEYKENLILKDGAIDLIKKLSINKNNILGICSSSPLELIEAVVDISGIRKMVSILHSAEFDAFGKPHPLPYINCAASMNCTPENCIVFEDSVTGAISGKSAGMKVVAVPDNYSAESCNALSFSDLVLKSLCEYDVEVSPLD